MAKIDVRKDLQSGMYRLYINDEYVQVGWTKDVMNSLKSIALDPAQEIAQMIHGVFDLEMLDIRHGLTQQEISETMNLIKEKINDNTT